MAKTQSETKKTNRKQSKIHSSMGPYEIEHIRQKQLLNSEVLNYVFIASKVMETPMVGEIQSEKRVH